MTRHIDTSGVLVFYRNAWTDITDLLADLTVNPVTDRTVLMRRYAAVQQELALANSQAQIWADYHLPAAFAAAVAGVIGTGRDLTEPADRLSGQMLVDLYAATMTVESTLKALVRRMASDRTLAKAEGDARTERARELVKRAGVAAAVYANGARQPLDAYADMVLTTQTQIAVNRTAVQTSDASRWLLTDGPDCGLTDHNDPEKADGMVVDTDTALAYPVAHPNCTREMYPAGTQVNDVDSELTD